MVQEQDRPHAIGLPVEGSIASGLEQIRQVIAELRQPLYEALTVNFVRP